MQDEGLDALHESVVRLAGYSEQMTDALTEQDSLIDSIRDGVDDSNSMMESATKRAKRLMQSSGGVGSMCLILCLTVLVVFLFALLIIHNI